MFSQQERNELRHTAGQGQAPAAVLCHKSCFSLPKVNFHKFSQIFTFTLAKVKIQCIIHADDSRREESI